MSASVVAGVDAAPVLEASEHVLDLVPLAIEFAVVVDRLLAIGFGRDARRDAAFGKGPLITRRSSTLAIPCDNGKYRSIRRICASDSRNKSAMATPPRASPMNQPINQPARRLMGPDPKHQLYAMLVDAVKNTT